MRPILCSAVLLLLAGCGQTGRPGVEIDSSLKGYILPNSKVLAGVDLDKMKQTGFFKRHEADLQLDKMEQMPAEVGIDIRHDLSSFLFAWNGTDTMFMTHGSFSSAQLQKRLSGVTQSEKYDKLTLYGDGKRDIVFLPKSVALVGSAAVLKKALNDNGELLEDLQSQLARLDKAAQVWEVSSGVIPLNQFGLRSDTAANFGNIADYINGSALGIKLTSGIALDAHLSCVSDEGAKRVHDALRGLIGLARLSTRDDQLDQLKIWDSIKVEMQAKEVHVTANLSADFADKAITVWTSRLR